MTSAGDLSTYVAVRSACDVDTYVAVTSECDMGIRYVCGDVGASYPSPSYPLPHILPVPNKPYGFCGR